MKYLRLVVLVFLATTAVHAQNVSNTVKSFWWNVADACFTGRSLHKQNSMFMSTASRIPVGATYKVRKGLFGKVKGTSLDFTHTTLKKQLPCFPDRVDSASASPPCPFVLKNNTAYQIEIAGKLADQANIGKISLELERELRKAIALNLRIDSWGFEIMEQGLVETCLQENKENDFVKTLRNGNRYVALEAIWIEGLSLDYELDQEAVTSIKSIYESKKEDFIKAGVTISIQSEKVFTTSFKYDKRFYPFYRFGLISRKGDIKEFIDVIIKEPNFEQR